MIMTNENLRFTIPICGQIVQSLNNVMKFLDYTFDFPYFYDILQIILILNRKFKCTRFIIHSLLIYYCLCALDYL